MKTCDQCGGLIATEDGERIAGTMCKCGSLAAPGSPFLEVAQACFMEWVKVIELELGMADDNFNASMAALANGDRNGFADAYGKGHGHLRNALNEVREAAKRGFETENEFAEP